MILPVDWRIFTSREGVDYIKANVMTVHDVTTCPSIGGIPVTIDPHMPKDEIHFRDSNNVVHKIVKIKV